MTADDRLKELAESFLAIEATGAELATFLIEVSASCLRGSSTSRLREEFGSRTLVSR